MPAPARLLSRFVAFTGLGLLVAFSVIDKGPSRALQWPWFLYAQLLWLTPILWLVVRALGGGMIVRCGGALDWALLAFAAAQIVAALFSPFPETSIAMLPCVLAPVALAYAVAAWLSDGDNRPDRTRPVRLTEIVAIALGGLAVVSLLWWLFADVSPQHAGGLPWSKALLARNERPLGHSNYTAGLGLLTVAWLGARARERPGAARLVLLLGAAAGLTVLVSSGSRGGFLGLGAWLIWFGVTTARLQGWSVGRVALAALAMAAVGGSLLIANPRTRLYLREWHQTGAMSMGDRQRLAMLEFGRLAVREHPLFGIGPGATSQVYPHYRARLSGGVESALQLHSMPVQIAVDAGLVGLAALFAVVVVATGRAWRARPIPPPPAALPGTASGVGGVLVAYAVMATTDYQLDVPFFAAVAGGGFGLFIGAHAGPVRLASRPARWTGTLLAVAVTAFAVHEHRSWSARAAFAGALDALSNHDVAGYQAGTSRALALAPTETYFRNLHGLLQADLRPYPDWFEPVDLGPDHLTQAVATLEESLRGNPDQELAHFNLGWLLLERAPGSAERHFREAARLVPDKGGVYFGLGLSLWTQQKHEAAIAAWALELVNDPAFATSPVWAGTGLPSTVPPAVRARAAAELTLIANAIDTPDPLGAGRRARYTAALLRWLNGDDASGRTALASAEPGQGEMLNWLTGQPAGAGAAEAAWQVLAQAATHPLAASAIVSQFYSSRGRLVPTADALSSLADATRTPDRRTLLLAGSDFPAALVVRSRRERTGYGLLMRNLDGPPPRDLYLVAENRIVRDFLQSLFPPKGYLPAPALVAAQSRLPD